MQNNHLCAVETYTDLGTSLYSCEEIHLCVCPGFEKLMPGSFCLWASVCLSFCDKAEMLLRKPCTHIPVSSIAVPALKGNSRINIAALKASQQG